MALLLLRLAPDQLVLVSDALGPYGLGEGRHRWDERLLLVTGGTLPLLEGVRRLVGWGAPPERAIAAATLTPRRVLGDRRSATELLLRLPLAETLHWSADESTLHWRRS